MTTYLCGGINGLSDGECRDWRDFAKSLLKTETLDPMRRDYRGKEDQSINQIVQGDLEDIGASQFILVNASRPTGVERVNCSTPESGRRDGNRTVRQPTLKPIE